MCRTMALPSCVSSRARSGLPMTLGMTRRGHCGQGLTGLLFAFFLLRLSPPAWVQCSVWKGLPRTGQVSLCGHPFFSVSQLGSCVLGDQHAKVMCSPTDPFDQGVVATDEVKEEPPEPFQKIGPSMRDPGAKGWRGWGREAARATLLERRWLQPCNCVPACWLG